MDERYQRIAGSPSMLVMLEGAADPVQLAHSEVNKPSRHPLTRGLSLSPGISDVRRAKEIGDLLLAQPLSASPRIAATAEISHVTLVERYPGCVLARCTEGGDSSTPITSKPVWVFPAPALRPAGYWPEVDVGRILGSH